VNRHVTVATLALGLFCPQLAAAPSQGAMPPIKIRDVRPIYPRHLKTAGIGGHVVVQGLVGADGIVSNPMVVRPTRKELADAAVDAIAHGSSTRYT
jgi:outer membrane biosynthesis protein TonB